jgi:alpha-glucoside transport system permease protein
VDRLGPRFERIVRPWVFVTPALVLLAFYLVYPTIRTIWISLTDGAESASLDHYLSVLSDPTMLAALRNNAVWLVVGTTGSVIIGLAFAALADRVKREALAKTFIFLPLAISMVGAAVIWRFVYYWRPPGQPQIGIVNGLLDGLGRDPIAFFQVPPLNTFVLILIMVWLQTGFAMVILSAAIKGIPDDLLEAARIDGANELQVFGRIVLPGIRGSIITVGTTIFIVILKVFDIVFVTTGGRFDTDVVAVRMFTELIRFRNPGRASALAVVLLVAVVPIMVVNVRNLRRQGVGA